MSEYPVSEGPAACGLSRLLAPGQASLSSSRAELGLQVGQGKAAPQCQSVPVPLTTM